MEFESHADYENIGSHNNGNNHKKTCSKAVKSLDTSLNFKTNRAIFSYAGMVSFSSNKKYGKEQYNKYYQGHKPGKQFFLFCHIIGQRDSLSDFIIYMQISVLRKIKIVNIICE